MSLAESYAQVCQKIATTQRKVHLIAVSKNQPIDAIRSVAQLGQVSFGENYVQELIKKADALADLQLDWHFLGHLQRNKINHLLPSVSTIHSIDSIKLAEAIAQRATQSVSGFIEINIGGETSKTGLAPTALPDMLRACSELPHLEIKGLMCIPPPTDSSDHQKRYFTAVANLQNEANSQNWYKSPLTDLSMGMSHDFLVAIDCGATYVRVGTSIFGERTK